MKGITPILLPILFSFLLAFDAEAQRVKLVQGELIHDGKRLVNQPVFVEFQKERSWFDWFLPGKRDLELTTSFAITDNNGFFQLVDLPLGEYKIMWLRVGEKEPILVKNFKLGHDYDFRTLDVPAGSFGTQLLGINDQGGIVGMKAGETAPNGFLYRNGEISTISVPNSNFDQLSGINNSGIIVGSYVDKVTKLSRAFLYDSKKFTTIDPPGAKVSYAYGINDQREVVGFYQDDRGVLHGFIYADNNFTHLDFPEVFDTRAAGINNKRQIVGYYYQYKEKRFHGFVYDKGVFVTIDYPGPDAFQTRLHGINDNGDIVGFCSCGPNRAARGFLYRDGIFIDLQFPKATETFPSGINRHGSIVGYYNGEGGGHGFQAITR